MGKKRKATPPVCSEEDRQRPNVARSPVSDSLTLDEIDTFKTKTPFHRTLQTCVAPSSGKNWPTSELLKRTQTHGSNVKACLIFSPHVIHYGERSLHLACSAPSINYVGSNAGKTLVWAGKNAFIIAPIYYAAATYFSRIMAAFGGSLISPPRRRRLLGVQQANGMSMGNITATM